MKMYSQPSTCICGSGKPHGECCGQQADCKVIHFSWGKKNQYNSLIDIALNDLVSYVRAYFYKYEEGARAKFVSYANSYEIEEQFASIFWHWYVLNYRCYNDVSPIIDFYLAEKSEALDAKLSIVFNSLKNSYLSLYKVKWINNNAVALQDIWLGHEFIIERSFGLSTRLITPGSLILARLVTIENATMLAGKTIIVPSAQGSYLLEEMEFIRLNKRVEDKLLFIREHSEVLCGLVNDLTKGIKKNRIKAKTLLINKSEHRFVSRHLLRKDFSIIERNKTCLKLTYNKSAGSFSRIYFLDAAVIIVGESLEGIDKMLSYFDLSKVRGAYQIEDGFNFSNEEEAEEVLLEITHDRYLDDWLNSPHYELEDMTPLQAITDIRGRVLLDSLLRKLELLELRAKSKDEYYIPTKVIRTRLSFDAHKLSKELMHPDAISIKVKRYRLHQELSPFVTAYNWHNEEYRQIGIQAFDWFYPDEAEKLAWILFMLNEYSNIYLPRVSLPRAIIAALDYTYMQLNDVSLKYSQISKSYGVSTSLIGKHAQLLLRHFNNYKLNFSRDIVSYPSWNNLNDNEKMRAYDEVWQHLYLFTYASQKAGEQNKTPKKQNFYEVMHDSQRFWTKEMKKTFADFDKYYSMLDFKNENKMTIANMFWENQAKRFPPYLKTAAFNIMMSSVGVYRIYPEGLNNLIFEDYFTGKTHKVYGNFGFRVHDNIIPGMLGLTRLLPLGDSLWVNDPMFIILPDLADLFANNIQVLLEEFHPFDPSDYDYLKKRGEMAIKAYIVSLDELEQNAVNLMNQPLQIEWQRASIINYPLIVDLLKKSRKLTLISEEEDFTTFIWMSFNNTQYYQWGYIIVTPENILITTPPGKELPKLLGDVRAALRNEDIVIAFRVWEPSPSRLRLVEHQMVRDLAGFFNSNPDLSLALLRQDELNDEELEWQQGIFLLKLGSLLMDYLEIIKDKHNF